MARRTPEPVQMFRGTTAQHSTYIGPAGELTVDVDKDTVVVHDGSTLGGHPLAKAATTITASNGVQVSAGGTLGQNTIISGVDASTTAKGVVQLSNATTGTSQTKAATEKAVADALTAAKAYTDSATGAAPNVSNATGTLPVAHGGTGLTSSPSMLTNLGSTTADNVLKASPRPGVTGTLPIANGGTGSTTKNFVDLTSAQTVAGTKTLTANPVVKTASASISLQQTDIVKGTNPSAGQSVSISMVDSAGIAGENRTGYLENIVSDAGLTSTSLYAYQFTSGSTANAALGVHCSADGTQKYATAPTPAAGDNSTKIATTAWVTDAMNHAPVPVGTIIWSGAATVPAGYLLCNGAAVGRATYPELFAAIGTTFGPGNGRTTFNLPNLIDKFIEGSTTAGTVKAAGLPEITGTRTGLLATSYGVGDGAFTGSQSSTGLQIGTSGSAFGTGGTAVFKASNSNAIYGNGTTVQPPAVTALPCIKAFAAVIGDATVVAGQLVNDIQGKVALDGSNTASIGSTLSTYMAHAAMPSGQYEDMTTPASGGTVTAPADGWVALSKYSTNAGQYAVLQSNSIVISNTSVSSLQQLLRLYIPVKKDAVVKVEYSAAGTTDNFRFIYANGTVA